MRGRRWNVPKRATESATVSRKLLSLRHVSEVTGLTQRQIRAAVEAGEFPPPLPLGPWDFGWPQDRVETWLAKTGGSA